MWSSAVPYLEASPPTTDNSDDITTCCAFRIGEEFPQGDISSSKAPLYRFLCWVIWYRTLDLSIEKSERLRCPLSSCKEAFGDQQYLELVSHVASCQFLARGLYDCPYHHKEERFLQIPYLDPSTKDDSNTPFNTSSSLPNLNPYNAFDTTAAANPSTHHHQPSLGLNSLKTDIFIEFDREAFPEVIVSDQAVAAAAAVSRTSPTLSMSDSRQTKRKYSEFEERSMGSSYAEHLNDPLPESTDYGRARQFHTPVDMGAMFELPAGFSAHGGQHMASHAHHPQHQPSPEMMGGGNSPQTYHNALAMGVDPFGSMGIPGQVGARISPPLVSPGFQDPSMAMHQMSGHGQRPLSTGAMMQQQQHHNSPMHLPTMHAQSASPKGKERASSNASNIVPSHHIDLESAGMQEIASASRKASSDGSELSPGATSPAGTAEAERGSVQCKECGKVLRGKVAWLPSNLQRHMREIHLSAPKTECRVCGKQFNRGHNLKHHMKAVHGEQP